MMERFDWYKKSLGPTGFVPKHCPICKATMADKGWEVTKRAFIICKACSMAFDGLETLDEDQ